MQPVSLKLYKMSTIARCCCGVLIWKANLKHTNCTAYNYRVVRAAAYCPQPISTRKGLAVTFLRADMHNAFTNPLGSLDQDMGISTPTPL